MKEGYIKLYRGLEDNPLWTFDVFSKAQAWIDLLLLTNHKPGHIRLKNGEIVQINRGECGWSMESLAKRWQWSRGKVKRFFDYLKNEKMIQQTDIPKVTIIKVLNYERFQNDTSNGHQIVHQTDTNNNGKNDKNNTTTILEEKNQNFKIFGKFQNVALTSEQYQKLLGICMSKKLLDELIDSLSEKIETGDEHSFRGEFPNTHFIRLQKYREYRVKNPEKFVHSLRGTNNKPAYSLRRADFDPTDRKHIFEELEAEAKAKGVKIV